MASFQQISLGIICLLAAFAFGHYVNQHPPQSTANLSAQDEQPVAQGIVIPTRGETDNSLAGIAGASEKRPAGIPLLQNRLRPRYPLPPIASDAAASDSQVTPGKRSLPPPSHLGPDSKGPDAGKPRVTAPQTVESQSAINRLQVPDFSAISSQLENTPLALPKIGDMPVAQELSGATQIPTLKQRTHSPSTVAAPAVPQFSTVTPSQVAINSRNSQTESGEPSNSQPAKAPPNISARPNAKERWSAELASIFSNGDFDASIKSSRDQNDAPSQPSAGQFRTQAKPVLPVAPPHELAAGDAMRNSGISHSPTGPSDGPIDDPFHDPFRPNDVRGLPVLADSVPVLESSDTRVQSKLSSVVDSASANAPWNRGVAAGSNSSSAVGEPAAVSESEPLQWRSTVARKLAQNQPVEAHRVDPKPTGLRPSYSVLERPPVQSQPAPVYGNSRPGIGRPGIGGPDGSPMQLAAIERPLGERPRGTLAPLESIARSSRAPTPAAPFNGPSQLAGELIPVNGITDSSRLRPDNRVRTRLPFNLTSDAQSRLVQDRDRAAANLSQPSTRFVEHTIVSGETLQSISKRYYGKPDFYLDIYLANRNYLRNPADTPVGVTIRVPLYDRAAGN